MRHVVHEAGVGDMRPVVVGDHASKHGCDVCLIWLVAAVQPDLCVGVIWHGLGSGVGWGMVVRGG
jgi:hypothetical protein